MLSTLTVMPVRQIILLFVQPELLGRKTWATDPKISLYGEDGFHPELAGSLLAAMVIYGTLTEKKDFNNQSVQNKNWSTVIRPRLFNVLRKSAIEAIQTKL